MPPQQYDAKVDIYSLGIIFFELYQPFTTAMERADAIYRLKKGVFPDGFVERYAKESALILWMMDSTPSHRPSALQLLEYDLFAHHCTPVNRKHTYTHAYESALGFLFSDTHNLLFFFCLSRRMICTVTFKHNSKPNPWRLIPGTKP